MKTTTKIGLLMVVAALVTCDAFAAYRPTRLKHGLWVGQATDVPSVTPGDDDVYVKGTFEVDGAARFDGAITFGDAASDAFTMTGYLTRLRVGTGSTADLTHGSDDAFIEGQLEVDGNARLDGTLTVGGATITCGNVATVVNLGSASSTTGTKVNIYDGGTDKPGAIALFDETGADYFLWVNGGSLRMHTAYPSDDGTDGTAFAAFDTTADVDLTATGGSTGDPDLSTAASSYAKFGGTVEVDGAVQMDGNVTLGDAGADSLTVNADTVAFTAACAVTLPDTAYLTQLRIGTGSTPGQNSATSADGLFVEGVAEVDGVFQADGNVTLGNSSSADTVTITADVTLDAGTAITAPAGSYFTQLRVGTGSTPGDSNAVAADGLFVEGAVEIDGSTSLVALTHSGDILPSTDNARALGASGTEYATVWAQKIDDGDGTVTVDAALGVAGALDVAGATTTVGITHSGDIVPSAADARSIGASGTEYVAVWTAVIDDADGTVDVAAALTADSLVTDGAVTGTQGVQTPAGYTLSAGCSPITTNGVALKDCGGNASEPASTIAIVYYDSVADQIKAIKNDGGGGTGTTCVLGDFSP